jgi:SAM-dependent methyltransferase
MPHVVDQRDLALMSFFPCQLASPPSAGLAIKWEECACPLCKSRRSSIFIEAQDNLQGNAGRWFSVVRCQDCGLCYTNPRPTRGSIGQFYPRDYWAVRAPSPTERTQPRFHRPTHWWRRQRERQALPWHGQRRLLDFGCGGGVFLQRMHRQGWHVTGIDSSLDAARRVRTELGLRALAGSLPHANLDPESFDVITMWQSLEHVHDPREVVQQAFFLLAPGGKLLVSAPNIESLGFQWFGRNWYGLDLPRHLTHFSPRTLTWMLERAGFHVGKVRMVRQTGWLRSSVALAAHGSSPAWWYRGLRTKYGARAASWYTRLIGRSDGMIVLAERPA